jgi:uncharacterized membrane protein
LDQAYLKSEENKVQKPTYSLYSRYHSVNDVAGTLWYVTYRTSGSQVITDILPGKIYPQYATRRLIDTESTLPKVTGISRTSYTQESTMTAKYLFVGEYNSLTGRITTSGDRGYIKQYDTTNHYNITSLYTEYETKVYSNGSTEVRLK